MTPYNSFSIVLVSCFFDFTLNLQLSFSGKIKIFEFCFAGTFEDKEITHVEGEVDPIRDLEIINEELRLKDEEYFNKVTDRYSNRIVCFMNLMQNPPIRFEFSVKS